MNKKIYKFLSLIIIIMFAFIINIELVNAETTTSKNNDAPTYGVDTGAEAEVDASATGKAAGDATSYACDFGVGVVGAIINGPFNIVGSLTTAYIGSLFCDEAGNAVESNINGDSGEKNIYTPGNTPYNVDGSDAGGLEPNYSDVSINCSDFSILHTIYVLMLIIAPVLVIVLGTIDYTRAVIAGDTQKMGKFRKRFPIRLTLLVVLFIVPIIIRLLTSLSSNLNNTLMYCIVNGGDAQIKLKATDLNDVSTPTPRTIEIIEGSEEQSSVPQTDTTTTPSVESNVSDSITNQSPQSSESNNSTSSSSSSNCARCDSIQDTTEKNRCRRTNNCPTSVSPNNR